MIWLKNTHSNNNLSNKRWNSMSLMQLPTPNTAAKVIVSFRYATAIWVMHSAKSRPARPGSLAYSHSLFTIVRRAFQTQKMRRHLPSKNLNMPFQWTFLRWAFIWQGSAAPFLSNNITISQFWGTLTSSSVAMNALMIFALAMTVVCYR